MTKTVFITGASAGAGKAMAYRFAKEGFNLYLVARRSENLAEIQRDIESKHAVQVVFKAVDLTDADALNTLASAMLSTQFVQQKKETDACLINVTSLAGYYLFPGSVPYSATKFFATAFTEGLYRDVQAAGSPLRVKVMTPGPIDTEFTAISLQDTKLQGLDASNVQFHTPEQIADFTYQLFESDHPVGLVDLASMRFLLRDTIHPSAQL